MRYVTLIKLVMVLSMLWSIRVLFSVGLFENGCELPEEEPTPNNVPQPQAMRTSILSGGYMHDRCVPNNFGYRIMKRRDHKESSTERLTENVETTSFTETVTKLTSTNVGSVTTTSSLRAIRTRQASNEDEPSNRGASTYITHWNSNTTVLASSPTTKQRSSKLFFFF